MMIRGFMQTTSLTALVAAAGMLMGTSAYAPANAADLAGGGCCADLEARVAELEATTARKGNRVVSLTVYGQVNKALLFWDNDVDSDTYVVDNDASSSRFGFEGKASMRPGWTAGYRLEVDLLGDSNSNLVTENNDEGSDPDNDPATAGPADLRLRVSEVYIESDHFGRVTIGQGSSAGDGIDNIVLGNSISTAALDFGGALQVGGGNQLGDIVDDLGTSRRDRVRYDSPSIYGFIVSASWGEDDLVDLALRFKKEWNSIRLAAGIAYAEADECHADVLGDCAGSDLGEFSQVTGSVSAMHIPTGIFVAFAAGERDVDVDAPGSDFDKSFWYGQLGVEKRFFAPGSTTLFAEYGEYTNDFGVADEEVTKLGFGIVQSIDSAAMDLYATAVFWDYDDSLDNEGDLTTVMAGAIIKF